MNQQQEDIDLIEFLFIFWNGKWIIVSVSIIAILISIGAFYSKNKSIVAEGPIYESEFKYAISHSLPIHIGKPMVISDFEKLFFSKSLFEDWKRDNNKSKITFDNLSNEKKIDGISFTKNKEDLLVRFVNSNQSENQYILVKVNKIILIEEIFSYTNFIIDAITSEFVLLSKDEIKMINERYKKFNLKYPDTPSTGHISSTMRIDKYLAAIEKGQRAVEIQSPTLPVNLNVPQKLSYMRICIIAFLGGLLGAFIALIKDIIHKYNLRKQRLKI